MIPSASLPPTFRLAILQTSAFLREAINHLHSIDHRAVADERRPSIDSALATVNRMAVEIDGDIERLMNQVAMKGEGKATPAATALLESARRLESMAGLMATTPPA